MQRAHKTISVLVLIAVLFFSDIGLAISAADIKNDANLSNNLVSCWELQETSGTRYDSHGSNHLTDNNTVGYGTGHILDNAADFERDNIEYLSKSNPQSSELAPNTGEFAISMWVKFESFPSINGEIRPLVGVWGGYSDKSSSYYLALRKDPDQGVLLEAAIYNSGMQSVNSNYSFALNTWYHIVFMFGGDPKKKMLVYINNSQVISSRDKNDFSRNNNTYFGIGKTELFDYSHDGLIEQVCVWKRILTTSEISDLYNSGSGIPYEAAVTEAPNYQDYYWFD